MAITNNTDFSAGAILTAQQQNNFPRGVMALATSTTTYTLTTSAAIATGMTVTFTAVANRNYKVTYYEPQAQTAFGVSSLTTLEVRLTNAAGTRLQAGYLQNLSSAANGNVNVVYIGTMTAGSVTIVGCANCSSTAGTPTLARSATAPAQITVEDIGTA